MTRKIYAVRKRCGQWSVWSDEDVYLNFAGMSNKGDKVVLQAYVFPLVSCIWSGYWILLFGTLICLVPSKQRLLYARTEVVKVTEKHVKVED